MALHSKPYDGHTLKSVLGQIIHLTGIKPREVQVDFGYRDHGIKDDDMEIILARRKRGITPAGFDTLTFSKFYVMWLP